MSESAQVHSIELLQRLRDALARFGADAQASLGAADQEIRRVENALDDRLRHWQQQVLRRQELVNQARAALMHARTLHEGKSIGCVEQELALKKAQEKLREAEDKVATVKRWLRELPNIVKDFEGPARGLAGFVDADLRRGIVLLENKIAALEAYLAIREKAEG